MTKNSTASRAMRPGKKRYMAFLNPIASPTHSTRIPRVPRDEIYLKIYPSTEKFSKKSYVSTCDDVHDEEEEGCADSPGGGGHDLHDHGEQDGEPGLREQVVQGWRTRLSLPFTVWTCTHPAL